MVRTSRDYASQILAEAEDHNFVGYFGAGVVLGAGVTALACVTWSIILFARWAATTLRASARTGQLTTD